MRDATGKTTRVLVVDDDPSLVRLVQIHLEMEGFKVLAAHDGEEGLALASEEQPDIILLDVDMPGLSGAEVCRRLRADPATGEIPIVFLTAKVDIDAMEEVLEDEAQGYLLKPFSQYVILEKIEEVLGGLTGGER